MIRSTEDPEGGTSGLGFSCVVGCAVTALGSGGAGGAGATAAGAVGADAGGGEEPPQAVSSATTAQPTTQLDFDARMTIPFGALVLRRCAARCTNRSTGHF